MKAGYMDVGIGTCIGIATGVGFTSGGYLISSPA